MHLEMIQPVVIGPQSNAKIKNKNSVTEDVKKLYVLKKFKSLFLLREVFKWYLKTSLRRNKLFLKK